MSYLSYFCFACLPYLLQNTYSRNSISFRAFVYLAGKTGPILEVAIGASNRVGTFHLVHVPSLSF